MKKPKSKTVQDHDELTLSVLQRYHHISNVTENLVNDSQLDRVAELIDQADRVYFFGIGSSWFSSSRNEIALYATGRRL